MPRSLDGRDRGERGPHISSHPHLATVWWEPIATQRSPSGSKVGGDKEKELLLRATKPGKTAPQNCTPPCLSTLRPLNVRPAPASQQATQGKIDFRLHGHPVFSVLGKSHEQRRKRRKRQEMQQHRHFTNHVQNSLEEVLAVQLSAQCPGWLFLCWETFERPPWHLTPAPGTPPATGSWKQASTRDYSRLGNK